MVRGIQRKSLHEFKKKYQSLDLLLIDDIQFLAGKERTQEEFFYTFEALLTARKQLIITSDTYPKELSAFEDRLVSRFGSGLIVEIEPPELEMRVAILLKKAEQSGEKLPEEVAFFVAKNLRSNVRELEGALLRVIAFARFRNKAVTADLAKEALKDLLELNRPPISIESIQKTVADFFKIRVADMYSKRRPAHIARARQVAMYCHTQKKRFPRYEGSAPRPHHGHARGQRTPNCASTTRNEPPVARAHQMLADEGRHAQRARRDKRIECGQPASFRQAQSSGPRPGCRSSTPPKRPQTQCPRRAGRVVPRVAPRTSNNSNRNLKQCSSSKPTAMRS